MLSSLIVPRIKLRQAEPADAKALTLLQAEIYQEGCWFVGDGPVSADALMRRLRVLEPDRGLYLLATLSVSRQETALCAWLELQRQRPRRLQHIAVLTIAVTVSYRRQGIAGKLLQRSYHWARRNGIEKIQLSVRANNEAAISLYEEQGFELEGRERRQIKEGETYEDNLLMAKFL